jgi:hypothetical protein
MMGAGGWRCGLASLGLVAALAAGCGGEATDSGDSAPPAGGDSNPSTGGEGTAGGESSPGGAGGTTADGGTSSGGTSSGGASSGGASSGGASSGGASSGGASSGATSGGGASSGGASSGGSSSGGGSDGGTGGVGTGGDATGGAAPVGGNGGATGGGAGGAGGIIDAEVEVQKFLDEFVSPYCTRLQECCAQEGFEVPTYEACQERELLGVIDHLEDGTSYVVSDAAAAFAGSIASTCDQPAYETMVVTRGILPEGSPCEDVGQCAGEAVVCDVTGGSELGICRSLVHGQVGDPCLFTCETDVCRSTLYRGAGDDNEATACWDADGLYCDWGSEATYRCMAIIPPGEPCEEFGECGATGECSAGECVVPAGLGEDCTATGGYCQSTMYCDSSVPACIKMSIAWSGSCEP